MFTGIVEELGVVASLIRSSQAGKLVVSANQDFAESKIGDSIAVNGVCLTISNLRRNFLEFDVSSETIRRTTLGQIKVGEKVNLERALMLADRLGGHVVNGHIDGVAEIRKIVTAGKGFDLYLALPSDLLRYLVYKGSLAIEGVSLTAAEVQDGLVVVAVIPHTAQATTLGQKRVGDRVNVEVDILSKYIERHLRGDVTARSVTEETMSRAGFFPMGWVEN